MHVNRQSGCTTALRQSLLRFNALQHSRAQPTEFFQSLGIPFPHAQAILVGTTECIGGLLLLLGLLSRLASIPLTILLNVAYLTADIAVVKNILGDPDKFLAADEFLFLFVVLLVLLFGPGKFSIDWLFNRKVKTET